MLNKIRIKNKLLQNFKKFFTLNFLLSFFLLILFLSSFFSNYNKITIIFKVLLSLITILITFKLSKTNNIKLNLSFTTWEKILIFFLIYLFLSIFWSYNSNFGLLKLIQIVFVFFPLWLIIRQNVYSVIKDELKILLYIFLILNFFLAIYIIIFNPITFSKFGIESRTISQVFSGRLLTLAILGLFYLRYKENKQNLIIFPLLVIFSFSLGIISFRAGIFSIIVVFIIMLLHKSNRKTVFIYFLTFIFILFLSSLLNNNLIYRMTWITELEQGQNLADSTVNTRIKAFIASIKLFNESPIIGVGLGGFNTIFNGDELGRIIKYPHNLFLELLCELGIIGFLIFLILLIKSLIYFKFNNWSKIKDVFYLFIVLLIFSQFSKDLSTNIVLILPALVNKK